LCELKKKKKKKKYRGRSCEGAAEYGGVECRKGRRENKEKKVEGFLGNSSPVVARRKWWRFGMGLCSVV